MVRVVALREVPADEGCRVRAGGDAVTVGLLDPLFDVFCTDHIGPSSLTFTSTDVTRRLPILSTLCNQRQNPYNTALISNKMRGLRYPYGIRIALRD